MMIIAVQHGASTLRADCEQRLWLCCLQQASVSSDRNTMSTL